MSAAKAAMPALALRFLAIAAANTLIYSGYVRLWFGTACNAFMAVGRHALGEGSAVLSAATTVSYAIIGSGFLFPFSLMLAAARSMAVESNSNSTDAEEHTKEPAVKGPRQILRVLLQDAAVVGVLLSIPFVLLIGAGALVKGMSPAKESGREKTGSILMDVGIFGASALQCFIVLPIASSQH